MKGIQFRASACGRYIVSLIGESVRVLTVDEVPPIRDLYRSQQGMMLRQGQLDLAEHEGVVADALDRALLEAAEIKRALEQRRQP